MEYPCYLECPLGCRKKGFSLLLRQAFNKTTASREVVNVVRLLACVSLFVVMSIIMIDVTEDSG